MNAQPCRAERKVTDLVGSRLGWVLWGLPIVLFVGGSRGPKRARGSGFPAFSLPAPLASPTRRDAAGSIAS